MKFPDLKKYAAALLLIAVPHASLADSDITQLPIHAMMDFNYKTKQEIYDLRTGFVQSYPQFIDGNYTPSDQIFGRIEDGKPWWGILGRSYYGPGQKSIAGLSEESRYIANPFLLVALDSRGWIITDPSITPVPIYPEPSGLYWQNDRKVAGVEYNITAFQQKERQLRIRDFDMSELYLVAYNARDLGYNFLYILPEDSENVTSPATQPIRIIQFIHTGGSCRYPGGCNNMSPDQKTFHITLDRLPATATIKLWKNEPPYASYPADMTFIIKMM